MDPRERTGLARCIGEQQGDPESARLAWDEERRLYIRPPRGRPKSAEARRNSKTTAMKEGGAGMAEWESGGNTARPGRREGPPICVA